MPPSIHRVVASFIGFLLLIATLAPFFIAQKHVGTQQLTNLRERERKILQQEKLRETANRRNANPKPVVIGSDSNSEKAAKQKTADTDKPTFHFVVSSDCSPFQRWQVLVQMHSAIDVGITGRYTWIMSGCPADYIGEVKANKRLDHKSKPHGQDGSLLSRSSVLADIQRNFPSLCGESAQLENADPTKSLGCPSVHFTPDYSDMSIYGGPYADGTKRRFYKNSQGKVTYSSYGK